eukprot:3103323-Prymnesium_polylepis.2
MRPILVRAGYEPAPRQDARGKHSAKLCEEHSELICSDSIHQRLLHVYGSWSESMLVKVIDAAHTELAAFVGTPAIAPAVADQGDAVTTRTHPHHSRKLAALALSDGIATSVAWVDTSAGRCTCTRAALEQGLVSAACSHGPDSPCRTRPNCRRHPPAIQLSCAPCRHCRDPEGRGHAAYSVFSQRQRHGPRGPLGRWRW